MTDEREGGIWWRTRGGLALLGFLAIAGFFLVTEHTAHVLGVLPYVLLLACPLMHAFMHRGHHRLASRECDILNTSPSSPSCWGSCSNGPPSSQWRCSHCWS